MLSQDEIKFQARKFIDFQRRVKSNPIKLFGFWAEGKEFSAEDRLGIWGHAKGLISWRANDHKMAAAGEGSDEGVFKETF